MSKLVVGGEECPLAKVMATLTSMKSFGRFLEAWKDVARSLSVPPDKSQRMEVDYRQSKLSLTDLLHSMIVDWMMRNGSKAKLDYLIWAFQANGLGVLADSLTLEFIGQPESNNNNEDIDHASDENISDDPPISPGYTSSALQKKGQNLRTCFRPFLSSPEKALLTAADSADMKAVTKLVKGGAYINARNNGGETPLHRAARKKGHPFDDMDARLKIVEFLIDNGADVLARDKQNENLFIKLFFPEPLLSPPQFHELCECLVFNNWLEFFTTQDKYANSEITPLMWSLYKLEVELRTIKLLYENGLEMTVVDEKGWTLLFWAIYGRRSGKLLRNLIELGVDPKRRNERGQSPLDYARLEENRMAVEVLERFA